MSTLGLDRLMSRFYTTSTPDISAQLRSTDWEDVYEALQRLHARVRKTDSRFDASAIKKLATNEDRLKTVVEALGNVPQEALADMMDEISVQGMNASSAHIMAERARQNLQYGSPSFSREGRREVYKRNAKVSRLLGETIEQARYFYNNLKFFPTITAHPTKDKNPEGRELYRRRIAAIDSGADISEIEAITREMASTRLTPSQKDDLVKETEDAINAQSIILQGMLNWLQDKQDALNEVHGYGKINFMDEGMHIDIADRRWQAGDADGKPTPASVLLGMRIRGACAGAKQYLEILEGNSELGEQYEVFQYFDSKLQALYDRIDQIEKAPSDSEVFIKAKKDFADVFLTTSYKGQVYDHGPGLTAAVMGDLKQIANETLTQNPQDEAGRAARRTVLMHKQVGVAVGKQEIRHNGADYKVIFDNLFDYLKEADLVELPENMGKFSKMEPKQQAVFLQRFVAEHKDKLKDWLFEANGKERIKRKLKAQGLIGEAYEIALEKELWPLEILERFGVLKECYNHNRLGFMIIAEADASSGVLQQVMVDAFGIQNVTHCPLNEDQETIAEAAEAMNIYAQVFGAENMRAKIGEIKAAGLNAPLFYALMDAQSDSQKSYGFSIKWLQRASEQDLIKQAIRPVLDTMHDSVKDKLSEEQKEFLEKRFVGILRKIGTGAAYARGGFHPAAVPRLFLEALSGVDGIDIEKIPEEFRPVLKQMVCFISTTIQGRDTTMRMGTPEMVQDMIEDVESEARAACLVIDGLLSPEYVTHVAPTYSRDMKEAISETAKISRYEYSKMRERKSVSIDRKEFNSNLYDLYMEKVSALSVSEAANTGARKDARTLVQSIKAFVKKAVTGLRAIGSNIANDNAENLPDGSYTVGLYLETLHQKYHDKLIDRGDIYAHARDGFFMHQVMTNSMTALAEADYEHGFDKCDPHGGEWTVKRLIEVKNNKWAGLDELTRFHAVLAYDALKATALIEAMLETPKPGIEGMGASYRRALSGETEKNGFDHSIDDLILRIYEPEDRMNILKFGPLTHEFYPDLAATQEMRREKMLGRAIVHEVERRVDLFAANQDNPPKGSIDPRTKANKKFMHHIACARRMQGPINMRNLLGRAGFRVDDNPVFDRILEWNKDLAKQMGFESGQGTDFEPEAAV